MRSGFPYGEEGEKAAEAGKPAIAGDSGDLRQEMIGLMADIARKAHSRPRSWGTAGAVARRVVESIDAMRTPEMALIEILGSKAEAVAWMESTLPVLRMELEIERAKALGPAATDTQSPALQANPAKKQSK